MSARLTPKKVEVMLKNHYCLKTLAEEMDMSKEDATSELEKIYNSKALSDIMRRLKANEKAAKKVRTAKQEDPVEVVDQASDIPNRDDEIAEIDNSIRVVKNDLDSLEQKHQQAASKRNSLKNRILSSKDELVRMQAKIELIEKRIEETIEEYNLEGEKMQELTSKISEYSNELSNLEEKKEALSRVSILVYSDGQLEVNEQLVSDIPADWEEIHKGLFGNEAIDGLTGMEAKQLAKVMSFIRHLDKDYEICFESNDMQAAFNALMS